MFNFEHIIHKSPPDGMDLCGVFAHLEDEPFPPKMLFDVDGVEDSVFFTFENNMVKLNLIMEYFIKLNKSQRLVIVSNVLHMVREFVGEFLSQPLQIMMDAKKKDVIRFLSRSEIQPGVWD
jgi:hypothetical protein